MQFLKDLPHIPGNSLIFYIRTNNGQIHNKIDLNYYTIPECKEHCLVLVQEVQ